MSLTNLVLTRRLATFSALRRPVLSSAYKTDQLWAERLKCSLLRDENMIKSINNKIMSDTELNNLELDIFMNVTSPRIDDAVQLTESARLLSGFRRSLAAHLMLPSTSHATCRLFLQSNQLKPLVSLLEHRVKYGIFPDQLAFNLLLDAAIEAEDYTTAGRLAALVMLQEEFGINMVTDCLSLFAVSKLIELKTDFTDWSGHIETLDPILDKGTNADGKESNENAAQEVDDEDEEDAEYVRIPWLINPYTDGHFDLNNPRHICGKVFEALSKSLSSIDKELSVKTNLTSNVLQGRWSEVIKGASKTATSGLRLGPLGDTLSFYVDNLHGLDEPDESTKKSIMNCLKTTSGAEGGPLSELAESRISLKDQADKDVRWLEESIPSWSSLRLRTLEEINEKIRRKSLAEEVRHKKLELMKREQYLYFYDNLKKASLRRIEYN